MSRLNSRQKRAAKVRLALHDLAVSRNPSTQVKVTSAIVSGEMASVRSALNKHSITPTSTRAPQERWEGQGKSTRSHAVKRWSITK